MTVMNWVVSGSKAICVVWLVNLASLTPIAGQDARSVRIGYLALISGEDSGLMKVFEQRLGELGWHRGKNLVLNYRSADGQPERLDSLAQELLSNRPDLIVTGLGTLPAQAAKRLTKNIPILFTAVGDPLAAKLVDRLDRPGGNITGMSTQISDLGGKRLQLMFEICGRDKPIAVLRNPQTPLTTAGLKEIQAAAQKANQKILVFDATTIAQVRDQFGKAASEGAGAIIVLEDPLMFDAKTEFRELISRYRIPTMFGDRSFVYSGGLLAYGPDRKGIFRRAAEYADKILRGQPPGELSIEQPTKFELVINQTAARVTGIELPGQLLAIADEVIE